MSETHEFGKIAEDFAANFLVSKGYCILQRNWRYSHKELDIICTDGKFLVVVEVKARVQNYFPDPEDLLSREKERYIIDACEEYLYRFQAGMPVRIDLISVIKHGGKLDLEHLEDVIVPGVETN